MSAVEISFFPFLSCYVIKNKAQRHLKILSHQNTESQRNPLICNVNTPARKQTSKCSSSTGCSLPKMSGFHTTAECKIWISKKNFLKGQLLRSGLEQQKDLRGRVLRAHQGPPVFSSELHKHLESLPREMDACLITCYLAKQVMWASPQINRTGINTPFLLGEGEGEGGMSFE